jgi:hypothetical protein
VIIRAIYMQSVDATWNSTLMHPKRIDSIAGVLEMKKESYTDQCRFSVRKSAALDHGPSDYFQINQREAISAIQFVRIQAEWISESIRKTQFPMTQLYRLPRINGKGNW